MIKFKEYFLAENMSLNVYHGTPNEIEGNFSLSKIGTGEGAQVYGWGLYFAEKKDVADKYSIPSIRPKDILFNGKPLMDYIPYDDRFSDVYNNMVGQLNKIKFPLTDYKQQSLMLLSNISKYYIVPNINKYANDGESKKYFTKILNELDNITEISHNKQIKSQNVYKVKLRITDDELLNWDSILASSENVETLWKIQKTKILEHLIKKYPDLVFRKYIDKSGGGLSYLYNLTGEQFYKGLLQYPEFKNPKEVSMWLNSIGIKGIKYKDQISRSASKEITYNYVIFDDRNIKLQKKMQ